MRRMYGVWLAVAALAALLCAGCAGILSETMTDDGQTERIRVGSSANWRTWDRNPIKQDDSAIMLKKESTF